MKRQKVDTHIHCEYSSDSHLTLSDLCKKAVRLDYSYIAITEHFDLIESEVVNYGILSLRSYFRDCQQMQQKYPQLQIVIGLEIGEPHRQMDLADKLLAIYRPDYLIGSLHVLTNGRNISLPITQPLTQTDIRLYYEETLAMVERGGFDTLGHLGIYKRGLQDEALPDESYMQSTIDEIFRVMIRKEIALEVNNSSFRSFFANHLPDKQQLLRYRQLGGELICLASDSHDLKHFDTFYDKTLDSIQGFGFSSLWVKSKGRWEPVRM